MVCVPGTHHVCEELPWPSAFPVGKRGTNQRAQACWSPQLRLQAGHEHGGTLNTPSAQQDTHPTNPVFARPLFSPSSSTHAQIEIPPAPLSGTTLGTGAFAVAWNAFVLTWTLGALAGGGLLFALFSLPFWVAGVGLARSALAGALLKERVQVGLGRWGISRELAVFKGGAPTWTGLGATAVEGATQDLSQCRVHVAGYVNGVPQTVLQLKEGAFIMRVITE